MLEAGRIRALGFVYIARPRFDLHLQLMPAFGAGHGESMEVRGWKMAWISKFLIPMIFLSDCDPDIRKFEAFRPSQDAYQSEC